MKTRNTNTNVGVTEEAGKAESGGSQVASILETDRKPGIEGVIEISEIRTDGGTQTRVTLVADVVSDYAEAIDGDIPLPPIIVFHDGIDYWLADGFHRLAAVQEAGKTEIAAEIRAGGKLEALRYALGANRTHGLRRTGADKRRCVALALEHFGNQSDRALAELCGVGNQLVGDVRRELCDSHSSGPRVGRDGKTRSSLAKCPATTIPKPAPVADQGIPELDFKTTQLEPDDTEQQVAIVDGSTVAVPLGVIVVGALKDHLHALESPSSPMTAAQREWLVVRQRLTAKLAKVINSTLGEVPSLEALVAGSHAICWVLATLSKTIETRQKDFATRKPITTP